MRSFAASGLCNLALDLENKSYIIQNNGVPLLCGCLSLEEESITISVITTLMFLVTPQSKPEITATEVVKQMLRKTDSDNPRISNLAKIFLSDYCTPEQVMKAKAV